LWAGITKKSRKIETWSMDTGIVTLQWNFGSVFSAVCGRLPRTQIVRRAEHIAELLAADLGSTRTARDRRLAVPIRDLKEHIAQVLALKHDDSDRTSPFSSHLSFLEQKQCRVYSPKELHERGLSLVAEFGSRWTKKEERILDEVLCSTRCVVVLPFIILL
jgi:hypothetical protein